jgi:hypothetical protein
MPVTENLAFRISTKPVARVMTIDNSIIDTAIQALLWLKIVIIQQV